MTAITTAPLEVPLETPPERTPPSRARALMRSPLMIFGVVLLAILVVIAIFAPLIAPYNPRTITGAALEQPSSQHWLGTDIPGRDIFSQLVYGARISLIVAIVGASLAMIGAILIGVVPALIGGATDTISNRFTVFLLALPGLPLIVLIGALAGPSQAAIILVIATSGIAPNARVLRAEALTLRNSGFITAARGFGGGRLYVVRRHLLPALGPIILVGFVNWASTAIALEAALTFLGLGDPSASSWGLMLNRALAQQSIYFSPMWTWWVLPPGIAVTLAILSFAFVGIALEPVFNPRWLRSS
ncbi:MAG: ABC transporter permease [Acidimicrobiia bacterium]|nr:ABC transporter permease [Acidimicrobiia bacterium]